MSTFLYIRRSVRPWLLRPCLRLTCSANRSTRTGRPTSSRLFLQRCVVCVCTPVFLCVRARLQFAPCTLLSVLVLKFSCFLFFCTNFVHLYIICVYRALHLIENVAIIFSLVFFLSPRENQQIISEDTVDCPSI